MRDCDSLRRAALAFAALVTVHVAIVFGLWLPASALARARRASSCLRSRRIGPCDAAWSCAGASGSAASSSTRRFSGSRRSDVANALRLFWLAIALLSGLRRRVPRLSQHAPRRLGQRSASSAQDRRPHASPLRHLEPGRRARAVRLHQRSARWHRSPRRVHRGRSKARRRLARRRGRDRRCSSIRSSKKRARRRTSGRARRSASRSRRHRSRGLDARVQRLGRRRAILRHARQERARSAASRRTSRERRAVKSDVREVGGIKVGIAGVSAPRSDGRKPEGVTVGDAARALKAAVADLRAQGAKMSDRSRCGAARRGASPGRSRSRSRRARRGQAGRRRRSQRRAAPSGARRRRLVVGTSNHLADGGRGRSSSFKAADFQFQDATGVANAEAVLLSLDKRIRDLESAARGVGRRSRRCARRTSPPGAPISPSFAKRKSACRIRPRPRRAASFAIRWSKCANASATIRR